MVIGWDQVKGSDPTLYYGEKNKDPEAQSYPNSKKPDWVIVAKEMNNHYVRLSRLQPNTVYSIVIKSSEGVSRGMSFKTAPASPNTRLSIIAGGDSRNHREARNNANRMVGKLRPDFVLFTGSMTADDSDNSWKEWFDDWQYTMGPDRRLVPIIPVRRNHEASNSSIVDLFDVVSSEVYYALSFGSNLLRIYTLNTLIPNGGNQKSWLENDLKKVMIIVGK